MRRSLGNSSRRLRIALALLGMFAAVAVTGASAADFAIDDGPCRETPGEALLLRCPTAYVGVPYEVQIESEEGSGCEPYVWYEVVNSTLPPGLTMSRSGLISGTPTGGPGLTRFWLWNHDLTFAQGGPSWCQREDRSEHEFSIPVDPGLAIVTTSLPPATLGQPYSQTLATKQVASLNPVAGTDVQASWSVESGSLPPGVTLSPSGVLTGTPSSEGSYQFTLKAAYGTPSDAKTFALGVRQPVTVKSPFAPAVRATSEVGIGYEGTATAAGGTGTYTWSLASGALPPGLALDTATGAVSGKPQTAGAFTFTVAAKDAEGRVGTSSGFLKVAQKLAIKTVRLKSGTVGRVYRARVATVGGVRPFEWKVAGKLPPGVRFAKGLGVLLGSPRQAGAYRMTFQAGDALGASAKRTLVLEVKP